MKARFPGKKRKPDGTGTGTDGEGDDPAISLPQPVYVADGGHDGGEGRPNAGGRQVWPTALPLRPDRPKSIPNDQGGARGGTDVDNRGVSQGRPNIRPGVEDVVVGGPGQEGDSTTDHGGTAERVSPSPSIPPILQYSVKPNGV